jgi:16S rRNA (adenine1518-N6/adenine1519-N6)-dimethyltransferase
VRRLGQHFLSDPRILDRIVAALDPEPDDVVIEVGPGHGTLTRRLAPLVRGVIAMERDRALAGALSGRAKRETGNVLPANVSVVQGDALRLDWAGLVTESPFRHSPFPLPAFKAIGNIPYYITTPLIEKALALPGCRLVVYLVQREVAERLAAQPGSRTYGALSAGVQSAATVERLFTVRRGAFQPAPKVDSALVRLRPLSQPLVERAVQQRWRAFLAALFSQRRKQLGRSLRSVIGGSKEGVGALLQRLNIDPAARPELLGPAELARIFHAVPAEAPPPGSALR